MDWRVVVVVGLEGAVKAVLGFLRTWASFFLQLVAVTAVLVIAVIGAMQAAILAWNLAIGTISVWWHQAIALLVILLVISGFAAMVRTDSCL